MVILSMNEDRFHTTGWDSEQVRRKAEGEHTASRSGQTPARRRRKKKNPLLRFSVWLIFVVIASAILAGVGWLLANDLCAFNKDYMEVEVVVEEGDDAGDITRKLKDAGLIEYGWFFRLFSMLANLDEKIDEGLVGEGPHTLNTDMDYRALITGLYGTVQSADTVKIMIPEGYSVQQIINLLAENGVSNVEDLTEAAANYVFADYTFVDNENLGDISRLEGYLYPDTYEFFVGESATRALGRFLANFDVRIDEEMMALIEESGKSLQEILTVASLIEKETDGTDREKIASVIYNRLANPGFETGGLLQIDAALIYATGKTEITEADKALDNPYNLYKYAGLPPTPICNPGRASIWAALDPEDTNYYYYVLGSDGKHIFSETYAQHQQVIAGLK